MSQIWREVYGVDKSLAMQHSDVDIPIELTEFDALEAIAHSGINLDDISDEQYDAFLQHHGIKGQRWGVRRYQNEDGSLTNQGKKRYANVEYALSTGSNLTKGLIGMKAAKGSETSATTKSRVRGGVVGSILFGGLGGAVGSIIGQKIGLKKDIEASNTRSLSPEDFGKQSGSDEQRYSLIKALHDGGYANKLRSWINSKLSKDTNKSLTEFDSQLERRGKAYEQAKSGKEKREIKQLTATEMKKHATEMLKDMGWEITESNIWYLTNVIWQTT